MKSRTINILLLFVSICLSLLLGEIIVRVFLPSYTNILQLNSFVESERGKFAKYDEQLGWDGKENAEDYFSWVDTKHYVKQNRFGYRGKEYSHQRSDKQRILVLGDSFVWGFGVEDQDIFTSVMEREACVPIEIVNMGVSGYGNDQEYLLWQKKGHFWHPDIVILMITLDTDPWDNARKISQDYHKPSFEFNKKGEFYLTNVPVPKLEKWNEVRVSDNVSQRYVRRLLKHSALANFLIFTMSKNTNLRNCMELCGIIPDRLPGYVYEYPLYITEYIQISEDVWSVMFKLIELINIDVKGRGGELIVGIIPSVVQVYPELWDKFIEDNPKVRPYHLDSEAPNKRIIKWGNNNNVRVVDLLPEMKKYGKSNPYLYFPINLHWTKDGHKAVSKILLQKMKLND